MKNEYETKSTHILCVVVPGGMHSSVLIKSVRAAWWDTVLALNVEA